MKAASIRNHAIASRINDILEVFYKTSIQDEEKINSILDEVELWSKAFGSVPEINLLPSPFGSDIEFIHLFKFLNEASEFATFGEDLSPIEFRYSEDDISFLVESEAYDLEEIPTKIRRRYISIGEKLFDYFKREVEDDYGLFEHFFGEFHDEREDPRL